MLVSLQITLHTSFFYETKHILGRNSEDEMGTLHCLSNEKMKTVKLRATNRTKWQNLARKEKKINNLTLKG